MIVDFADCSIVEGFEKETFDQIAACAEDAVRMLDTAQPVCKHSDTLRQEIRNAAHFILHGCRLCQLKIMRLQHVDLQEQKRLAGDLDEDMKCILQEYKEIWQVRNRLGTLEESMEKLYALQNAYRLYAQ